MPQNDSKDAPTRRMHAFSNDILGDLDAVALAALLKKKEVSPKEVAEAAIKRANAVNNDLNAIEIEAFDDALRALGDTVRPGLLGGVPTFIKDNADWEGYPTRNGSRAYTPHRAKETDRYTAQFLSLGFTALGKSTMPEFGFNASTEFENESPTRNPWNLDFTAGGSSGGSAALVAAGVVPIAHGNDGGGSIRVPAACCGLVGLKPTRGRHVNNKTASMLPLNIISEGVLTRSVRDTAHYIHGLETVYQNPRLKPVGKIEGPSKRKLRIGLVIDSILGNPTEAQTRKAVEDTARLMEKLGHTVEPVTLKIPTSFISDFMLYWSLLAFLLSTLGKFTLGHDSDAKKMDSFTRGLTNYYKTHFLETPLALYRLKSSEEIYKKLIRPYDAVLSPVVGYTTPRIGYLSPELGYDTLIERLMRFIMFTPLNNATGSPAISLPMGMTDEHLPIGVQFQAVHGEERTLLDIAYQLEAEKPFRKIN